jgi:DNA-binding PucR family transcriptional regulator
MSQLVLDEYQAERDRWTANRNSIRALRVREVLDDGDVDVDATTEAIRYPLRRCHLAVIAWCPESPDGDELATMERFIGELAESAGAVGQPLSIAADRVTAWAWIPFESSIAADSVERIRQIVETRTDGPWVAAGEPSAGVEGFRASHRQAQAARVVATATTADERRFTAIGDQGVSLAALHGDNVAAARIWVHDVLGPLASTTDADRRLRETLEVFLRTGSSFKAAAEELHLHSNGVKYRVQRAVERRGRAVANDRLDVEVALLLCHRFGEAVLS